jgi:thiol-disulfide isomerase/thioredoxin
MRSLARALALAGACVALHAFATTEIRKWEGGATPPLAYAALDGGKVDLQSLRGRVVLVNFWATWCVPCREEMPSIARLREKLRGRPFDVLAVNYGESRERVAEFVRKEGVGLPVLLDTDMESARTWKAKGLPMTFLVDAEGRVRYWSFGERDWSRGDSLALVQDLLDEAGRARH